jgi:hypothetical protein
MKSLMIATVAVAALFATSASAQRAKTPKAPAEVTVANARAANITGFAMTDDAGKVVGKIAKPIASGKSVKVKLAKGAPCTLNVAANFDDDTDGAEGQVDVCSDKTIRFTD